MRIEHTRNTRQHQNVRIRLKNLIFVLRIIHVCLVAQELLTLRIGAFERVMIVNKRHGVFAIPLASKRIRRVDQQTVVFHTKRIVKHVFQRKIKDHRVKVRRFQVTHLLINALPILGHGEIGLSRLIVHLQITACETQRHVITEPVIIHLIQHPLQICF